MKPLFPFILNVGSPQAKGLLFWGPGGPGSGNMFDFSGRQDNGQLNGTVPTTGFWVPGVDNGKTAVQFDGGTIFVSLTKSDTLPVSSAVSVSCWVKTSNIANYNYLIAKWGVANGTDTFQLRIDQTTGFVYWTVSSNGNYQPANDLNGTTSVADGKWHLITATYDGTTSNVYVDGLLQSSLAVAGALFATASFVRLGGLSDGNLTANWLNGQMDDPRIYNYALSAKTIADMYKPATRWTLRTNRRRLFTSKSIPAIVVMPEVRTGVPRPGSPWFQLRALTSNQIAPIIIPADNSSPSQATITGPPRPGSPWFRLQPQQNIVTIAAAAPPAAERTPSPQMFVGPPLPGAPWFVLMQQQGIVVRDTPPPIKPQPNQPDKSFSGPPLPGAPWFVLRAQQSIDLTRAPIPDFNIVQKVICSSRATFNSGVLATGRRPERPGIGADQ
jgi:hypothetical protein